MNKRLIDNLSLGASLVIAACGVLSVPAGASEVAVVSHIKVLSDKVEDVSSPEDWKKAYIQPGMSDQEKALAIWKTVVKYRHQASPPQDCFGGCVHEMFKTIHVYGYGQCCCASACTESLARYIGLEARGRIINCHSVPEIGYGGGWHLLDGSLMDYFLNPDGTIASVDEIRHAVRGWFEQNPDLAKGLRGNDAKLRAFAQHEGWKKGPVLLAGCSAYDANGINAAGWHGWPSTMQEYDWSDDKCKVYDYGGLMGYQLNLQLRPGEQLTRNWFDKGDHINAPEGDPSLLGNNRTPLGVQTKLGDIAPGRIGNGTDDYDVPLASAALADACLQCENLKVGKMPIRTVADAAKPGSLVIRMPSSYVYLGGSITLLPMVGAQGAVTVSISHNNGLDWEEIAKYDATPKPVAPVTIDLTSHIRRYYDYQLKFTCTGAGTGLETLRINQRIQHAQTPLPALAVGRNTITFSADPAEGTITYEGSMDPEEAKAHHALTYTDFHPVVEGLTAKLLAVGATGKGTATFTLATPGDLKRVRMSMHYRSRDLKGNDGYDAELSFDGGKTWQPFAKFDKGQPANERYVSFENVPKEVRLAQLRLSGYQKNVACIFGLRVDADYIEPHGGFRPVKITYLWEENGVAKQDVHVAKSPTDSYVISCATAPLMKSMVLELNENKGLTGGVK